MLTNIIRVVYTLLKLCFVSLIMYNNFKNVQIKEDLAVEIIYTYKD